MDYKERIEEWLTSELVSEEYRKEILLADEETKKEMFSGDLSFGTAGMRALLGPGSSRLNTITVRKATIGVAKFLLEKYGDEAKEKGVAISFDNRHYSKEFRDISAKVLTENGIKVFTFRDPHPTPELSYTVRKLGCIAGIMITASHNPKRYNGYKVYDKNGCQTVYEEIDGLIKTISTLPDEIKCTYEKVDDSKLGSITYLDDSEEYDEEFVNREIETSLYHDFFQGPRLTKIVFTPQCGCDCKVGPMALRGAGYEVTTVPSQDFFDPDFTGTPNPNPETEDAYLASFELLKKLNKEQKGYNLILCTDPDADRCGLAFLDSKGNIQRLTGNQTGALLIDFLLGTRERRGTLPNNACICNTFVTGSQGALAALMYNVKVRTTATGFKYIGDLANKMRECGENYLFGYEESYGYLLSDFVRDKDSLQSIIAIADMCEFHLRQGKTLDMALEDLDKKTGHFYNAQVSVMFTGANSLERMNNEVSKLRENPINVLGGVKVKRIYDYLKRTIIEYPEGQSKEMDLPDVDTTNCIKYVFENDAFLAIRPSGTEPKIKFYVEIKGFNDDEASKLTKQMTDELKKIMGLE